MGKQNNKFHKKNFKTFGISSNEKFNRHRIVTATPKRVFFNGGDAMEFVYFKHKFQNEFVHESCWDLVEPKPPIIVDGVSTPNLIETNYSTPAPVFAVIVDDEIASQIARVDANHQAQIIELNQLPFTQAKKLEESWKLTSAAANEKTRIENSRSSLETKFHALLKNHEDKTKEFQTKVGRCMGVFNKCLGEAAKVVIKDHLANHRFRAAFHQLGVHFHIGLGGHHNVQRIVEQVSSSTWDGQEDILSHISEIQVLVDEMDSITGTVTPSEMVLSWCLTSIRKSGNPCYEDDIKWIEHSNLNLQQSIQLLQKTSSRIGLENKYLLNSNPNLSEQANMTIKTTNEKKFCTKCKKTGHYDVECWRDVQCNKCGRKGHPGNRCRSNAGAKNKYQQKKVAGKSADAEDEGNAEATPLVAMFKNKLAIKDIKKKFYLF